MNFEEITKSDDIASLRELFSDGGAFSQFGSIFQISLILDANTILSEIRWLSFKARDKYVRTSLQESIDSTVVVAFAPTFLIEEVQAHIPKIAIEIQKDESIVAGHWEAYRKNINFVDAGGPGESEIDPKDVPYIKLHEQTGFPIATRDKDIARMGAKAVTVEISTITRDYSRNAAIEYKIKLAGLGTLFISQALVRSAVALIQSLASSMNKIPSWAWLLLIGGCLWAWSNPNFRMWLQQSISNIPEHSKQLASQFLAEVGKAFQAHAKFSTESNRLRERLSREYGV